MVVLVIGAGVKKIGAVGEGVCGWCGNKCMRITAGQICLDVMPAEGQVCVEKNGVCVTKTKKDCPVCESGAAKKQRGNADCDEKIGIWDFGIWKKEVIEYQENQGPVEMVWRADFNCDGKVNLVDYSVWKVGFINERRSAATPTTATEIPSELSE